MKIGWSTWSETLVSHKVDSSGDAVWTLPLWQELKNRGHEIVWLQSHMGLPSGTELMNNIEDVDVAFFYWRWPFASKDKRFTARNQCFREQNRLISLFVGKNIPVLVFDGDHMILDNQVKVLHKAGVRLYRPELNILDKRFKQLIYPYPFSEDMLTIDQMPKSIPHTELIYIGNNYGRYDQFLKYVGTASELNVNTKVYGNWLEESLERESPEKIQEDSPHIDFRDRIPYVDVDKYLSSSWTTIHLAKDSYNSSGFMTIRWAEAARSNCYAWVPEEFNCGEDLIKISSGGEIAKIMAFDTGFISTRLERQKEFVRDHMLMSKWIETIESF